MYSGIIELLEPRLEDVLKTFNVQYNEFSGYYSCTCPIHNSDNPNSMVVYKEGYIGSWKCYTNHCEEEYGGNLLGLVRGLLNSSAERRYYFRDTIDWILKWLGNPKIDISQVPHLVLPKKFDENPHIALRSTIRSSHNTPSVVFLEKGFSLEVLRTFDVTDCWNSKKELYGRTVCPVYDNEGVWLIGAWGRLIEQKEYLPKWRPNTGFKGTTFYGFWEAKKSIEETGTVILVEGMCDVLRLHEAGFKNAVGLFGVNLTDGQLALLNKTGVSSVTILLDGDEAGQQGAERIIKKCSNYFNVKNIVLPKEKDPADFSIKEITNFLI